MELRCVLESGLVILQARMSSQRLPGKVLKEINGRPMISWQIDRINRANVGPLVVATSTDESDDVLAEHLESSEISVVRGSLGDVADRFSKVLDEYRPPFFIRLTADCPLVMPELLSEMNEYFQNLESDYMSNTLSPSYPDGLDIEFVRTTAFERMLTLKPTVFQREHVTMGIYQKSNFFKIDQYKNLTDLSNYRWTVDYPEDLEFVRNVYSIFRGREMSFSMADILSALNDGTLRENALPATMRNIATREGVKP
jgi:spore coat polysaccharide biosynthesis protein SpsF